MPSILAFFNEPKKAYNCLSDVRKNIPKDAKAYTVAQQEYSKEEKDLVETKKTGFKIATKVGGFAGLAIGILVSLGVSTELLKSIPHLTMVIITVIAFAASGSMIGLLVMMYARHFTHKNNFDVERGKLILIVENPGDQKNGIVDIIQKHTPEKLKVY